MEFDLPGYCWMVWFFNFARKTGFLNLLSRITDTSLIHLPIYFYHKQPKWEVSFAKGVGFDDKPVDKQLT